MSAPELFLILAANLLLGIAFVPLYIQMARARNIIDVPNQRSSHSSPTPRGGGIFIAVGCLLSVAFVTFLVEGGAHVGWALFGGAALVAIVGFADDLKSLPSLIRLAGHFFAASFVIAGTFLVAGDQGITDLRFPLAAGALAGLAIWAVGCLNIYNFMDGIDGIAVGQGICAAGAWVAISLDSSVPIAAVLCSALLGGLLAFLCFNWSPAKVFMGDGASGFLGFSFAVLPLLVADTTPADLWLKLNLGAIVLFPFLFDGTYTLLRRASLLLIENGRFRIENVSSPRSSSVAALGTKFARLTELAQAHRSHLYQRWVQSGASHRKVASSYTAWAALGAAASLLVHFRDLSLLLAYPIVFIPAGVLLLHSRRFPI